MVGWLKKIEEKVDLMDLPPSERARLCIEIREALRLVVQEARQAKREKEEEDCIETVEIDDGYVKLKDYQNSIKPQALPTQLNRIL